MENYYNVKVRIGNEVRYKYQEPRVLFFTKLFAFRNKEMGN